MSEGLEITTMIITILMTIGVLAIIMLVLREVVSWYFKINVHLENQKEIISLLDDIQRNTKTKQSL